MPSPDKMLLDLPELVAGLLSDLSLAFKKVNANTLEGMGFASGPVFKMGDSEVQMRGRMAQAEGQKVLFFPAEQTEQGAEFAIRLPVNVEHPPDDAPWGLAMGLMVFDAELRRKVYVAAIKALSYVSMKDIGTAPVWRIGPDEYLVVRPGEGFRAVVVTMSGGVATGRVVGTRDALRRLVTQMSDRYAAVLGAIE